MTELGVVWLPRDIGTAVEFARAADREGFSRLGIVDSPVLYDDLYPTVTACLLGTERITIGPNVTNPVTRHWSVHGSSARTLDRLAPGRFFLGLGPGDGAVHGVGLAPMKTEELEASALAIRAAAPTVDLHLAAGGVRRAALAGRVADALILGAGVDPATIRGMIEAASAGRVASGRAGEMPAIWGLVSVHVVERPEEVEAARSALRPMAFANARFALVGTFSGKHVPEEYQPLLRERLRRYDHGTHGRETEGNPNAALFADLPEIDDYILKRFAIVGTPDECRRRVEDLVAEGLDGVWLSMMVPDPLKHLELAAEAFRPFLCA